MRIINNRATGASVETVAMSAYVYGAKMPEGHAVVVRTLPYERGNFDPCRGATTSNGEVPKEWLPLITWYDHDDEFAHGIGYATQDAYENAHARFGFRSATIEHATKAEFDAFLKNDPGNLIPPYLADSNGRLDFPYIKSAKDITPEMRRDPKAAWAQSPYPVCRGVQFIPLTEQQRDQVRQLWPADRPKYWAVPDYKLQIDFISKVLRIEPEQSDLLLYQTPYTAAIKAEQPRVFPVEASESLDRLTPETGKGGIYTHKVLVGDDRSNLGLLYCDSPSTFLFEGAITGHDPLPSDRGSNFRCLIGDLVVPLKGDTCDQGYWLAFERDEYAIIPYTRINN